jgi:hypothetical protein
MMAPDATKGDKLVVVVGFPIAGSAYCPIINIDSKTISIYRVTLQFNVRAEGVRVAEVSLQTLKLTLPDVGYA